MSGGYFKNRRKYLFFRKVQGGGKVNLEEKVSSFTTTTSKDPLLIAKSEGRRQRASFIALIGLSKVFKYRQELVK